MREVTWGSACSPGSRAQEVYPWGLKELGASSKRWCFSITLSAKAGEVGSKLEGQRSRVLHSPCG